MAIPREIQGQKYLSLATFRKNGAAVYTPIWFAEHNGKLCVMTRNDSGKYKRIRNSSRVKVAPCTMRGRITGLEFDGTARVLPAEPWGQAREALHRKYWMTRVSFLWSKKNEYLEIEVAA